MKMSSLAVRRGVTFSMLFLIIVGFGMYSLSQLRLDLYPDISLPTVVVLTGYTGASPEDIETLVTRPIEGAVASVKDAQEIHSTSKQGMSVVEVKFDWGKDMDQAETDVRRKLQLMHRYLPSDADESIVFAFDPSLQPIVMMMITGPYPLDELRRLAKNEVEPRLARLPGIASSDVAGGLAREIHVELDPAKIAAFNLNVNQVVGAIYRENLQVPGGSLQQGPLDFTIQTSGKYGTVSEINEVVVALKKTALGPVPIRLKEVAQVKDSFQESQRVLEVNGKPAVWMMVRKQSGANTVQAAAAILKALPAIKKATAADLDFQIIFNQADFINASLGNLSNTGMLGVFITFLVLLLFLRNMRSALIVATAIPVSVIATFGVMNQAHMTLNTFSMAGLALSIGMLVDNAIVVLENVFRLREQGLNAWDAAIEGASGVGTAVMASTLTTVSVFIPVLFVPGIAGILFKDMSITICFSLAVSLLVAVTFIPLAASRLFGTKRGTRLLKRAMTKDNFSGIRERYGRTLDWTLDHRLVVGLAVLAAIGITTVLAIAMPTEFVAKDDQNLVFVSVETPVGNNVEETHKILENVAEHVKKVVPKQERRMVALDVGVGKGFAAIFSKGVHAGVVRVPLVGRSHRKHTQAQLEQMVRDELKKIPGIKATVALPFDMMGAQGDIEIDIRGHNLTTSRAVGLDLAEKLRALPEMAEVHYSMQDQKPEVRVHYNRPKMAELGVSAGDVSSAISTYFMGKIAGRFTDEGDEYDILVRYAKDYRLDVNEVRKMPIPTPSGESVPLSNLADVHVGLGPVSITRLDQERVTKLLIYLRDSYTTKDGTTHRKDLGGTIGKVQDMLNSYPWPHDFSYTIGGTAEDFITSFRYLGLALLVSVGLVYMVMAGQFESFRQPFIIIMTVPLAGIGVVLMFVLTHSTMDISSLVGVIMLVGIVVNNAIVMVDAANQLREEGLERRQAIARAARIRLRPILMTSATTLLAMVPLALKIGEGSAAWSGMAKAVIGGLLVSTFLTLFVIPSVYTLFARKVIHQRAGEV